MANKKYTELPQANAITGAEILAMVQGGDSVQGDIDLIKAYFDTLYATAKPQCEWRADTHAGYGSTNTRIPYMTNVRVNVDTAGAITVSNSSTNGLSITINIADYYTVSYQFSPTSASYIGISLNSAQLTTGVDGITAANRLGLTYIPGTHTDRVTARVYCAVNDVIRPHSAPIGADTAAFAQFSINRG